MAARGPLAAEEIMPESVCWICLRPMISVQTAYELGWSKLKNGELLTETEKQF